jgi:hypothetical protein
LGSAPRARGYFAVTSRTITDDMINEHINEQEGEPVEVDDGIWVVSLMAYDLGYIDLELRTLQPIDNPFGTRVSPMS